MRKPARPTPVLYAFARRADVTLSRHAADILTLVLMRKEAIRRKLLDPDCRRDWVDYGVLGMMTVATGALFSLVNAWMG